jgi:ribosomal protein S18 acetylase RimI-like enzyme
VKHRPVTHSALADLDFIYGLFDESVNYQTKHGYPDWRHYDQNAISHDIDAGNHYKICIDDQIAIVFSVRYADKIIWRDRDKADAVYLHRIVVNPAFKGRRLFGEILAWAVDHCRKKGLRYVRMDTWADNPNLIKYYKGFGFEFVENFTTPDSAELPVHNRNLHLALLEYQVA